MSRKSKLQPFNPPAMLGAAGVSARMIPQEPKKVAAQAATDVAVADATTKAATLATAAGIYTNAQKSAAAGAAVAANNAAVTAAATKSQKETTTAVGTVSVLLALLKFL